MALKLEEACDERAGVVERALRQVELVLAFLLMDLGAPDQIPVGGGQTHAFVGRAAIDALGICPAREQQALVEAEGLVEEPQARAVAGEAELQARLPARPDVPVRRRLGHPGLYANHRMDRAHRGLNLRESRFHPGEIRQVERPVPRRESVGCERCGHPLRRLGTAAIRERHSCPGPGERRTHCLTEPTGAADNQGHAFTEHRGLGTHAGTLARDRLRRKAKAAAMKGEITP